MIAINEVFGPTVQGEGPGMGERAAFIRLAGCNLHCSWCDTPYTWDWSGRNGIKFDPKAETHKRSVADVMIWVQTMHAAGVRLFVVTGGEPLVQREAVTELVGDVLRLENARVEIETNGTQMPIAWWEGGLRYNVSPKLSNAVMPEQLRINLGALVAFVRSEIADFKFVCETVADLSEVGSIVDEARIPPDRVWIMPQARTAEELYARTRTLAPAAATRGYNFSSRLQVMAWGAARGH